MIIPGDEIIYSKVVGKQGDRILHAIGTCGGLHLIEARAPNGKREVIGAGSHRLVARHTAKRSCPDIEFTSLEKSSERDIKDFEDVLPFWFAVVDRLRNK